MTTGSGGSYPDRYASAEWEAWFVRHPDHHVVGAMIAHPMGCGRKCLDDAPPRPSRHDTNGRAAKILALSDTHIGAGYAHRQDALADTDRVLAQVAELAKGCDLVLHAGDVFHRAKPTPAEYLTFRHFTDKLTEHGVPMVVIEGNGSHSAAPGQRSALELFASPLVRISRTPEAFEFPGVTVCTLPAAPLSRLVAASNGRPRAELAEEAVELLLRAARDLHDGANPDIPAVLLAHFMVSGASLPTGLPVVALGGVVLPLDALEAVGFDAIVLGDLHKAQVLSDVPFVAYCGSPLRNDFGEEANEVGVWILDPDHPADHEFVSLDDRRFVTVDVDLTAGALAGGGGDGDSAVHGQGVTGAAPAASALDETDLVAAEILSRDLTDAVVRIRYRATEAQHRRVDHAQLKRAAALKGAHKVFQILPEVVRESRARVAGVTEALAPMSALDAWLAAYEVEASAAAGLRGLLGEYLAAEGS